MKKLIHALIVGIALLSCDAPKTTVTLDDAVQGFAADEFIQHVGIISSDATQGRDTGSPGYDSASAYIIRQMKQLGLKPGGVDGTYKQPIPFRKASLVENSVAVELNGKELQLDDSFVMLPATQSTAIDLSAPIVFAGFGIEAPELHYNDFEKIDVRGKVALVVRDAPSTFESVQKAVLSSPDEVQKTLISKGALGVITIHPKSAEGFLPWSVLRGFVGRPRFRFVTGEAQSSLPGAVINYRKAAEILKVGGGDYDVLMEKMARGEPASFDLRMTVRIRAKFTHETITGHNVAALLEGTDRKEECLVISAHLDHLGIGAPVNGDSIYNGTMDNAAGSTALLMLAKQFSRMSPPKRSILFLWVTGEEKGLLGSEYFARFPTVASKIVANQNMDGIDGMALETSDVVPFGYEHSELSQSVDFAVNKLSMTVSKDPHPEQNFFVRSDQFSFVKQGYPAVWLFGGRIAAQDSLKGKEESLSTWKFYHKPNDDMRQPMDRLGIERDLKLNFLVAYHIANQLETIRWNEESFLYKRFAKKESPGK